MFTEYVYFTLKFHTCFIKNPLPEKGCIQKKVASDASHEFILQCTTFEQMLCLFCVRFQRFRIILEEIIQIIIVIKQWCKNFFFTVLQRKHMSISLALQVSSNLIFRSLDSVRGNQIQINEIFSLIKILKYLLAFTAFHCDSNSCLLPKM